MSSILGGASTRMGTPFFHEFKKQASFFFNEKIKAARLAFTDVTPAELLTQEITSGNNRVPDAKTMGFISRAAFEIEDYWRIVEVLHQRLSKFERRRWREPYHAVIVLEHLLTHGPESVADEFQPDRGVIEELGSFQLIDERGFNWGLTARKKTERVLKLLEKGTLLREERDRARKVSRGIQGFGSFDQRLSTTERSVVEQGADRYGRSNSHYEEFTGRQEFNLDQKEDANAEVADDCTNRESGRADSFEEDKSARKSLSDEADIVDSTALQMSVPLDEAKPLLSSHKKEPKIENLREDHPFTIVEHERMESLLLPSQS